MAHHENFAMINRLDPPTIADVYGQKQPTRWYLNHSTSPRPHLLLEGKAPPFRVSDPVADSSLLLLRPPIAISI